MLNLFMGLRKASKRFHSHAGASGRPSCSACRHSARQTLNHDVWVWAFLVSKILALVVLRFSVNTKAPGIVGKKRSKRTALCSPGPSW